MAEVEVWESDSGYWVTDLWEAGTEKLVRTFPRFDAAMDYARELDQQWEAGTDDDQ